MNTVAVRTRSFFDREVIRLIIEKYLFDEQEAIRRFLCSETYKMFIDPEMEVYKFSPLIVFDMWEAEQNTGNPRNSRYIRSE